MVKADSQLISLNISVFIISDTRNERSDKSGKILEDCIISSGHKVLEKKFIKDDKKLIIKELNNSVNYNLINVIILNIINLIMIINKMLVSLIPVQIKKPEIEIKKNQKRMKEECKKLEI